MAVKEVAVSGLKVGGGREEREREKQTQVDVDMSVVVSLVVIMVSSDGSYGSGSDWYMKVVLEGTWTGTRAGAGSLTLSLATSLGI